MPNKARLNGPMLAIRRWLFLFGITVMVGAIPIMATFLHNRYEVGVQALVLPIVALLIIAAIIAEVFYRLYHRDALAGFVAVLMVGVILTNNFDERLSSISPMITALLPLPKLDGAKGAIISLIFMTLIFMLARWTGRLVSSFVRQRQWPARDLRIGASLALALPFIVTLVPTAKALASAWPQFFYKPPPLQASLDSSTAKPDIYYIVLEDYANQRQLANQFNFSNADFLNYLSQNGYYTNPTAHQNYPYTTMSLASTLNADYNTDLIKRFSAASYQTIIPYHRSVQYSSVVTDLKSIGYKYDEIGTWYETSNTGPQADNFYLLDRRLTLFGHTTHIDDFTQAQLAETPFWRFLQSGIGIGKFTIAKYQGQGQTQLTNSSLDTLKMLTKQSPGGRFIFAHLIIPHEPYYFNADGSLAANPGADNIGQAIKQKYIGQVKYINSQIEPILTSIKQQSHGQAVVILQSDEGPQPQALNDQIYNEGGESDEINQVDMRSWSNTDLALKYGAMSAYSIPNASASDLASAASSLNVFRLVFNRYFGTSLPYLSDCYYAYPDGRSKTFVYDDITSRITGQANSACAANGTGAK